MEFTLSREETTAVLDYEEFLRTGAADKKISLVYFRGTDQLNHERAVHILRYVFVEILHWRPEDVLNKASKKMITDLQLTIPYSKLIYPPEMSKKRDYYYMAKLLFPNEIHSFKPIDIIIHLYQQVLSKKVNFPTDYFSGNARNGKYRASVCLRFMLSHEMKFRSVEEMYEFFADQKTAMKYLQEIKLKKPCELFFDSALDYMDYSIPREQSDSLLYFNLKFHQVFDKSEAGKLWAKNVTVKGNKTICDTDAYLDCLTLMDDLPNVLQSYIPKDIDLKRMDEEAGKYMAFMNYVANIDRSDINFDDEDKTLLENCDEYIDEIIKDNLVLTEKKQ